MTTNSTLRDLLASAADEDGQLSVDEVSEILEEQLNHAAGEDGRLSIDEVATVVESLPSGPTLDDEIQTAEEEGDVGRSVRLKRQRAFGEAE